jgi:hypothetical protein
LRLRRLTSFLVEGLPSADTYPLLVATGKTREMDQAQIADSLRLPSSDLRPLVSEEHALTPPIDRRLGPFAATSSVELAGLEPEPLGCDKPQCRSVIVAPLAEAI